MWQGFFVACKAPVLCVTPPNTTQVWQPHRAGVLLGTKEQYRMAIVIAEVQIEGIRPLMFHVFGPDSIPTEKVERTGVAGNDPQEWKKTYTATADGQLYLRGDYVFSCLTIAARNTKSGSRGNYMSKLASTLQITDDILLLDR